MLAISALAGVGLIFFGFIVMFVMIFIIAGRLSDRRREGLKALAEELGFTFKPDWDSSFVEQLDHFYLFSRGRSPVFGNLMQSRLDDIEVLIFDYFYTVDLVGQSQVVEQTVMLFLSESLQLPSFILWPQNALHRIGKSFGYQDIDLPTHPEFSNSFLLQSEDEEKIREVFDDNVISFYEKHKNTSTEGAEGQLSFYRNGKPVSLSMMRSFIQDGLELVELFRQYHTVPAGKPEPTGCLPGSEISR